MAAEPSTGRASEVERGPASEADATRALYERHAGQLYGFCLHRLGSREEAEDAVQTTFLNAFRGLRRGIVPEAESAWLFKIAENVCLTRRRSAWRRGRVESPSDMQLLQDVTPARENGSGDELIPLGDALAAMPESQRRAILLREWQGLSYKEIADEMEVSQSAVETLIFRARRSLANALETPWQDRRAAGQAGRRAFDLGSLLAGLKALFAGGAAAKVAAVAAVAATGTAALAVAENRHPAAPARVEPSAAAAHAPDSVVRRPVVAPERLASTQTSEPARRAATAPKPKRAAKARTASQRAATANAKRSVQSAPSSTAGAPKAPPGQVKEPGSAASPRARASRPEPKPNAKPRHEPKTKAKPAPKPKAPAATKPAPKPESEPPAQPAAPFAPSPPPAPATPPPPPSEKEKEKAKGDGEQPG